MARYRIVYDIEGCISAVACVYENPEFWGMNEDTNKATIIKEGAKKTPQQEEIWIDEKDLEKNIAAAKACPTRVIKIFDENGNQIV